MTPDDFKKYLEENPELFATKITELSIELALTFGLLLLHNPYGLLRG